MKGGKNTMESNNYLLVREVGENISAEINIENGGCTTLFIMIETLFEGILQTIDNEKARLEFADLVSNACSMAMSEINGESNEA